MSVDAARILCTAQAVCTAKQPAGETRSRLGFCTGAPGLDEAGAVIGPSGLSLVMPNAAAAHIDVGSHVTLLITDREVG